MSFIVCSTCHRHHHADEAVCPFCVKRARRRQGAMLGVASLAAVAACQPSETPPAQSPATVVVDGEEDPNADPPEEPLVIEEEADDAPAPGLDPDQADQIADEIAGDGDAEEEPEDEVAPPFDRPMVARYGLAPRPQPTNKPNNKPPKRPVARYGVAPRW